MAKSALFHFEPPAAWKPSRAATELAERAARCPPAVLALAEQAGRDNLSARLESSKAISSQAATTLALLLAGVGGALSFAVRVFEPAPGPVAWGAVAVCIYFAVLAAILIEQNLSIGPAPSLHNSPKNLLIPDAAIEEIRWGEITNLQAAIEDQARINSSRADWLNRVRRCAIATPAVFAIAATAAARLF